MVVSVASGRPQQRRQLVLAKSSKPQAILDSWATAGQLISTNIPFPLGSKVMLILLQGLRSGCKHS